MKKKILIIDDEVDFSQMVKVNLEAFGPYEVRVENKGAKGHEAAQEFRPDGNGDQGRDEETPQHDRRTSFRRQTRQIRSFE